MQQEADRLVQKENLHRGDIAGHQLGSVPDRETDQIERETERGTEEEREVIEREEEETEEVEVTEITEIKERDPETGRGLDQGHQGDVITGLLLVCYIGILSSDYKLIEYQIIEFFLSGNHVCLTTDS